MKVLKEKVWEWEFTCKCCGSVCLAEIDDAKKCEYTDMWDDYIVYYFVECGQCHSENIIPKDKITGWVKIKSQNK
jgi:hypothetical protein